MKKLIVSGDSFTDDGFTSDWHPDLDTSYAKWPEHLGKHLGMEVINLARMGVGNSFIYSSLQDALMHIPKEEIGLVIAGWTQSHRKDWEEGTNEHYPYKEFSVSPWRSRRVDQDGDIVHFVRKSLRTYIAFQNLCENNNIPYHHFQMIDMFEIFIKGLKPNHNGEKDTNKHTGNKSKDIQKIMDLCKQYSPHIKNFLGWPGISARFILYMNTGVWHEEDIKFKAQKEFVTRSFTMDSKILGTDYDFRVRKGLVISDKDEHPNEKGHKAIADFIIQNLKL